MENNENVKIGCRSVKQTKLTP